jgi:hypothetical protein
MQLRSHLQRTPIRISTGSRRGGLRAADAADAADTADATAIANRIAPAARIAASHKPKLAIEPV